MDPLVDPVDAARRARAARAYASLSNRELGERTGLGAAMIRRICSSTTPRDGRLERLLVIADACDVPRWFMEAGFEGLQAFVERNDQRLDAVEQSLRVLIEGRAARASEPVGGVVGPGDPGPGVLGDQDVPPNQPRPQQDETDPEQADEPDAG